MPLDDVERAVPVGVGAAEIEHRLAGPRQRRREPRGIFGVLPRGGCVLAAQRFDIEAAQAE